MLTQHIVRRSHSDVASAAILAAKSDGSWRFCVDYRILNRATVSDLYPLPRIDALMDQTTGQRYFSTVDLKSGYWNVPNVVVYLDDILIMSKTVSGHLRTLRRVFAILRKAGLAVGIRKCHFLQREVTFLGYRLNGVTVRPTDKYLQKCLTFRTPKCVKNIQEFMGFAQ